MGPCPNIPEFEKDSEVSPNAIVFGSELQALGSAPVPTCFILATILFLNLQLYFLEFKGI